MSKVYIKGPAGPPGKNGAPGEDGKPGESAPNLKQQGLITSAESRREIDTTVPYSILKNLNSTNVDIFNANKFKVNATVMLSVSGLFQKSSPDDELPNPESELDFIVAKIKENGEEILLTRSLYPLSKLCHTNIAFGAKIGFSVEPGDSINFSIRSSNWNKGIQTPDISRYGSSCTMYIVN